MKPDWCPADIWKEAGNTCDDARIRVRVARALLKERERHRVKGRLNLPSNITIRMRDLAIFIFQFSETHGVSPSYEEMSNFLGVRGKSTAHQCVQALRERGVIETIPARARAVKICDRFLIQSEVVS